MIIKDTRGREYTLTSTRLAEVRNPTYYTVFSVTAKRLKKRLKSSEGMLVTTFEHKRADDYNGYPLKGTRWQAWDDATLFPYTPKLTRIGCARFNNSTAALIRKTMGIKDVPTTA